MSAFFGAIVGVILVAVVTFVLIILYFLNESQKKDKKSDEDKYNQPYKPFDYKFEYNQNTSVTAADINRLTERMDALEEEMFDRLEELEEILVSKEMIKKTTEMVNQAFSSDENKEMDIPVIGEKYSEKFNELVEETANKNKKKKAKADEKETKDEQH